MADPKKQEDVRQVNAAHREQIVSQFHALGTGVGRSGDEYIITVYLRTEADRPKKPVVIEGVRLHFEVTGEIRPHGPRS